MVRLAERVSRLPPIRSFNVRRVADGWRAAHPDQPFVDFSFADIPWRNRRVLAEAKVHVDRMPTGYRSSRGEREVREVVARSLERMGKPGFDPEISICITNGVVDGLHLAAKALLNPGDRALIPTPYYFLYPHQVLMADAEPVFLGTTSKNGFKVTPEQLEEAMVPGVRAMFFTNPVNNVGSVYSPDEMRALADVLAKHSHVAIFCDDVYDRIYLNEERPGGLWEVAPELRDRILIMNSLAKSAGLSEKRAGWVVGPEAAIDAIVNLKMGSSLATSMDSQAAIYAALSDQDRFELEVEEIRRKLRIGKRLMLGRLRAMGFEVPDAPAGIFLFPKVPDGLKMMRPQISGVWIPNDSEMTLAERFVYHAIPHGVALVPGVDLGVPDHFRVTFALEEDDIEAGMDNLQSALASAH